MWCDDGWELARTLHLADQALKAYDTINAAEQLGLLTDQEVTGNDRANE